LNRDERRRSFRTRVYSWPVSVSIPGEYSLVRIKETWRVERLLHPIDCVLQDSVVKLLEALIEISIGRIVKVMVCYSLVEDFNSESDLYSLANLELHGLSLS